MEPDPDFVEESQLEPETSEEMMEEEASDESEDDRSVNRNPGPVHMLREDRLDRKYCHNQDSSKERTVGDPGFERGIEMSSIVEFARRVEENMEIEDGIGWPIVFDEVNALEGRIEFYNDSAGFVSLENLSVVWCRFTGGKEYNHVFNFPSGLEIAPWAYLVMVVDDDSQLFEIDHSNDVIELYNGIDGTDELLDSTM